MSLNSQSRPFLIYSFIYSFVPLFAQSISHSFEVRNWKGKMGRYQIMEEFVAPAKSLDSILRVMKPWKSLE